MLIGLIMLYILNYLDAPTWCFVVVWISIIMRVIQIIINAYNYRASYRFVKKLREALKHTENNGQK